MPGTVTPRRQGHTGPSVMAVGALVVIGVAALAACGTASSPQRAGSNAATDTSMGVVTLPLLASGQDAVDGMASGVSDAVTLEGGCLRVGKVPVVWPKSATWDATAEAVTLAFGTTMAVGGTVHGSGGYVSGTAVSDMFGDAVLTAARTCAGADAEVVVLNATPHPPRAPRNALPSPSSPAGGARAPRTTRTSKQAQREGSFRRPVLSDGGGHERAQAHRARNRAGVAAQREKFASIR